MSSNGEEETQLGDATSVFDESTLDFEIGDNGEWLLTIEFKGESRTFPLGTPEELISKIEKLDEKFRERMDQGERYHETQVRRWRRRARRAASTPGQGRNEEAEERAERHQEKLEKIREAREKWETISSVFIKRLNGEEITADDFPGVDSVSSPSDELFALMILPFAMMFGGAKKMPDIPDAWKDTTETRSD